MEETQLILNLKKFPNCAEYSRKKKYDTVLIKV